jgi:S-adenosylmethionine hydrolase
VSHTVTGTVVEIDSSGNLITDILCDRLVAAPTDASLRVTVDEHETFGLYPPEHSQPAMTLIAIASRAEPLRIVLVGDSASMMLDVKVGAAVEVHW